MASWQSNGSRRPRARLLSASLEDLDEESACDARSLCAIFSRGRAESSSERSLLRSLWPGVQARGRPGGCLLYTSPSPRD
eukprot:7220666-Alexandrium_andersonii.AAC.1